MTNELTLSAAALRDAFDREFANAPATGAARGDDVLAIHCGGDPYGVRLAEVAGLHANLKIERVPSPIPELTGVAGLRGVLVPIYDLAALLGYSPCNGRWCLVARERSIGFAFDRFESHERLPPDAFSASDDAAGSRRVLVRGAVRVDHVIRPIIELAQAVELVRQRTRAGSSRQER
ncbi:MAG: chemotaxis protein CheW [Kofleriaceae bacterium]